MCIKMNFFLSILGHVLDCVREVHPRTPGPVLSMEKKHCWEFRTHDAADPCGK